MPETIDQYFVQQYRNQLITLAQQKESRLSGTTIPPIEVRGEYFYWERIGATEMIDLETRHDDTPNIEPEHSRRRAEAQPKVWATLLDRADQVRMLVDPRNAYNQAARFAAARAKDKIIIDALEGSAWAGKAGLTEVPLPAAQKIAHGDVGLTLAKILEAKEKLDVAEIDPDSPRYFVTTARQVTNLLGVTEVTSTDYAGVKALVKGEVNTFCGFEFIRTELLTYSASTWYCYAYSKGAVGFGILDDITANITQRNDKNFAWQPYLSMDMGATRVEDECVVQVACQ